MHILTREPDWINDPVEVICGVPNWFPPSPPPSVSPASRQKVTPDRRAEVTRLLRENTLSYRDIAEAVGISKTSVDRIASSAGLGRGSGGHNQRRG